MMEDGEEKRQTSRLLSSLLPPTTRRRRKRLSGQENSQGKTEKKEEQADGLARLVDPLLKDFLRTFLAKLEGGPSFSAFLTKAQRSPRKKEKKLHLLRGFESS